VNPRKTDGGMNILHVLLTIKKEKILISPGVLLTKIGFSPILGFSKTSSDNRALRNLNLPKIHIHQSKTDQQGHGKILVVRLIDRVQRVIVELIMPILGFSKTSTENRPLRSLKLPKSQYSPVENSPAMPWEYSCGEIDPQGSQGDCGINEPNSGIFKDKH